MSVSDLLSDPAQKRSLNRKLFSIVAPRYALITRLLSFFRDRAWKKKLVRMLPRLSEGAVAVDLASGPGDIGRMVAAENPGALVVGCDLTIAMIRAAGGLRAEDTIAFSCQDMGALGLKSGSVDCITGGYALRNAPDLNAALAECNRALKNRGIAAFLDFSKSPSPLVSRAHIALLKLWGGLWGLVIHGKPWVYGYIGHSLEGFPDRRKLRAAFVENGFTLVASRLFMFGVIELIVVEKNPAAQGSKEFA